MSIYTRVIAVDGGCRKSLLAALKSFGEDDNDFTGENGLEYLWDSVWKVQGFENYEDWISQGEPELKYTDNCTYLLDKVAKEVDSMLCVSIFFNTWLSHDSYYKDYDFDYALDLDEDIIAISLAWEV